MKIKIEKSYANCYYIMLLSIFITGYTLRSSILPGVFGYINFAFYISMFIILMRWIKYFNIRHIMIISAIFGGILYVDIMTGSNIYKSINSIFGFVLPLLLFCINYKRVIIDEELFITKCIKIVNFFTIVIFIYIVIDMVTNCLLTRTLSIIFPKLVEYIPKDTGFLKFRSASYLGHELYTKHFILMFYILNMLYHAIKLKYLMNPIIIHIIVMIGMVFSGSKIGILIVLFLILYFNFKNRNRIINITLIFLGLLILGYLGLFDYIINRFTTTTLTTGRSAAWDLMYPSLPKLQFIGGFGENLTELLLIRFTPTQVTAAFEYPFRIWAYRYGLLITGLILYEIYISTLYRFIRSKNMMFIISFSILIIETSVFNQLVYNPDLFILIILWNIILNCMFDLYRKIGEENENKTTNK